jgi:uncharacterized damage-inducible protein DinB
MKAETYSWRLSSHLKAELEEAARAEKKSVAELLEQIAEEWLERSRVPDEGEDEHQGELHQAAMRFVGSIRGDAPHRAENARSLVRAKIARRYGR